MALAVILHLMADPVENLAAAAEQVERGADEQAGSKRKRGTALEVAMKKELQARISARLR